MNASTVPGKVQYRRDRLVIELVTDSPEALHNRLMIAINAAVRCVLKSQTPDCHEDLTALTELQEGLIPTEEQLAAMR